MSNPVDLAGPGFDADPYPAYAWLRDARPVHHVTYRDGLYGWLVTRYEDARAALADPRLSKDPRVAPADWQEAGRGRPLEDRSGLGEHLLTVDPPDHTRLRRLVSAGFTPRRVEGLRDRVQRIADSFIGDIARNGKAELISEFAFPFSITVISELLGIPEERRAEFREWSTDVVSSDGPEDRRPGALALLTGYLASLVAERREAPEDDLISDLIAASEDEDRLSESEVLAMLFLLLIAGHESTVNTIGNGVYALLQHPSQLARLREQPDLLESAVEEMLRYDGPVETATWRFATEPVEISGTLIATGQPVQVVLAAADRDPDHFPDADQFDITRTDNSHLAFGKGLHYCLGAPLARIEVHAALTAVLRLDDLELAVAHDQLRWQHSLIMRGLRELPVSFTR